MNAITTGPGVSGTLADKVQKLIETLRADTGDERWRLHMQALPTPQYSIRVYAPDSHSEVHTIRMTANVAKDIREILANETELWQLRVRTVSIAADENGDRKTGQRAPICGL